MKRVRSIGILLRADRIAVSILIATIVIIAAVVAVGSSCRGTDRRSTIDAAANRGACYRAAIAAPCNCVSPTGDAVTTTMNRSASVIASTPIAAATTAPASGRIIRHEACAD
jgi:hypothetical protein